MNKPKFISQIPAVIVLLLMFSAGFNLFSPPPAYAEKTLGQRLLDLCAKKVDAGTKDSKTLACAYGYTLAISDKGVSGCNDEFKGKNKEIQACKTGYNLGKQDPLNAKDQGKEGGDNKDGNQGKDDVAPANLSGISSGGLPDVSGNAQTIKTILQIIFGIIGAFAVLNITFSGFKYVTSAGNEQKTTEAKNGIVYSLIGLAVAISAEAIVAFVVTGVSK